jgi:hypothetical protein
MLQSFSPDTTGDFQKAVSSFIQDATGRLIASLGTAKLQGDKDIPAFCTSRVGDVVHLYWPKHVKSGDLMAEIIGHLASQVPTVIIHECDKGWAEPEWTRDQRLRLLGIVAALQGTPDSFASSSSPLDIMRVAVWLRACTVALSKKGGVNDAISAPLPPSIGGEKSASKYILKTLQGLKAGQTDQGVLSAVAALDTLLTLWTKLQGDQALELIRKQKISWGTVLNAGAPTIKKKDKGREITQVLYPLKPSRSPWVTKSEAVALSAYFAPLWERDKEMRDKWLKLPADEQHATYKEQVKEVTKHFDLLKTVSTSVNARLGHRKRWIYMAVRRANKAPTKKNEKNNPFVWSSQFFKIDLSKAGLSIALSFAPYHYLADPDTGGDDFIQRSWALAREQEDKHLKFVEGVLPSKNLERLWKIWLDYFKPEALEELSKIPDSSGIKDDNKFGALPVDDWEEPESSDEEK